MTYARLLVYQKGEAFRSCNCGVYIRIRITNVTSIMWRKASLTQRRRDAETQRTHTHERADHSDVLCKRAKTNEYEDTRITWRFQITDNEDTTSLRLSASA